MVWREYVTCDSHLECILEYYMQHRYPKLGTIVEWLFILVVWTRVRSFGWTESLWDTHRVLVFPPSLTSRTSWNRVRMYYLCVCIDSVTEVTWRIKIIGGFREFIEMCFCCPNPKRLVFLTTSWHRNETQRRGTDQRTDDWEDVRQQRNLCTMRRLSVVLVVLWMSLLRTDWHFASTLGR